MEWMEDLLTLLFITEHPLLLSLLMYTTDQRVQPSGLMLALMLDHQALFFKLPVTKAASIHPGFLLAGRLAHLHGRIFTAAVVGTLPFLRDLGSGGGDGFLEGGRVAARFGGVEHLCQCIHVDGGAGEVQLDVHQQLFLGGTGIVAVAAHHLIGSRVVLGVLNQFLFARGAEGTALASVL